MTIAKSIRQAREAIVGALNSSGLPIDVMDMLLSLVQQAVHEQAEKEYREEELKEREEAANVETQESPGDGESPDIPGDGDGITETDFREVDGSIPVPGAAG